MPTLHIDFHVHTAASHDGTGTVDRVLNRAARAGLDGLAITDHDSITAARQAVRRAADRDLIVLPGTEVSTAAGHLLAIGVDERPPAGEAFDDTVTRVRAAGGVAIVPHPGQRTRHGVRPSRIDDVDGVETYNAWRVTGLRNHRAAQVASRGGYPALGGSDAHAPDSVGRAFTAVHVQPGADTVDGVLDALRAGHVGPRGEAIPIRRYACRFAGRFRDRTMAVLPGYLRSSVGSG